MEAALTQSLRELLRGGSVAALGTLHAGEPFVSMVPYALRGAHPEFLVHVSQLSAHTRDMLEHARVSLMVEAAEGGDVPAQALQRVMIQGDALQLPRISAAYGVAKSAYIARFPQAEPMFDLADFSLFAIRPVAIRYVAGFGRARSLTPALFAAILD